MRLDLRKIHWEIVIALIINGIFLTIFLACKVTNSPKPNLTLEISVDISEFKLPEPTEMQIPDSPNTATAVIEQVTTQIKSAKAIAEEAVLKSEAYGELQPDSQPKTSIEYKQELDRIERGIQTFEGINQLEAGVSSRVLPAGHQIGSSFQGRTNIQKRNKLIKRYGGDEYTETAVEKALAYLASVQNSNGSWGSAESFQTGDAAALSSLALLAFFSHGENFQSERWGSNIRKGCDFLIELANTPDIEYTGKGFGHAILTYALAEGYAVTGSLSLRNALEGRLKYIIDHQNNFGSFAINYDNSPQAPPSVMQQHDPLFKEIMVGEVACDLSLLGWHIQAMAAAKNTGIQIENLDNALALALEALVKIHQADKGGFSQGINMKRFPANENMNPVGLLGLYFLNAGNSSPARRVERILEKEQLPQWQKNNTFPLYRWYYQTQALFQMEKGRGKRWAAWNENLKKGLLDSQASNGSWFARDNSFIVKNASDITVYSTCLCALMLQVYYRYLPSYSIAESSDFNHSVDELDQGATGLISRLPGGADPMASVILGVGVDDMPPIKFGVFNSIPQSSGSPFAEEEFTQFASMRSTIAVRKVDDWPQTLQPNQRLALFFDDLLPKNFRGHLRCRLGVVGTSVAGRLFWQSLEVVLNGKRLYNSVLLHNKQLVDIIIPNDIMQPYGNILQIRNNGSAVIAFDAAELSAINKVGEKLFLLTDNPAKLPDDLRSMFHVHPPVEYVSCKLSGQTENHQLLSEISIFDPQKVYIAEYAAMGNEHMGNDYQLRALKNTGLKIVNWLAGGGDGVKITSILSGGQFFDSLFHEEYPALSSLRQVAKLFEGSPRKLSSQIYPKHGEKPGVYLSCTASYNAPGIATIIVSRRFVLPEESELIALIPWNGETELIIDQGILPANSPFAGMASQIKRQRKAISIKDNIFRFSGVFPELTVIRLIRKGARNFTPTVKSFQYEQSNQITFDHASVKRQLPSEIEKMKKQRIHQARGFAAVFGSNASLSRIPATVIKNKANSFSPSEKESLCINFKTHATHAKRFDSVYVPLENISGLPRFLSFDIFVRASGLSRNDQLPWVTLRFALRGKLYSTTVNVGHWQKIVLPLNDLNPTWQHLRFLEPTGIFNKKLQTISYEINDISAYSE